MNPNLILDVFADFLGDYPCQSVPELKLYLQTETGEIVFPAIVASCAVSAVEGIPAPDSAEWTATFSLRFAPENYTQKEVKTLFEEVNSALLKLHKKEAELNAIAGDLGISVAFYSVEWKETSAISETDDQTLSAEWTFSGRVCSL